MIDYLPTLKANTIRDLADDKIQLERLQSRDVRFFHNHFDVTDEWVTRTEQRIAGHLVTLSVVDRMLETATQT